MTDTKKEELQEKLKHFFKFESFKSEDQYNATLAVISTEIHDVLISLPPAAGKSICYQLPTMLCDVKITIVIVANKYTAEEQRRFLATCNIDAFYFHSRSNEFNLTKFFEKFIQLFKFVYVTSNMLMNTWFQTFIKMLNAHDLISFIVVDEAHCISEYYEESVELYRKITKVRDDYPHIKFIALTSIGTENIMTDIKNYLHLKNSREISYSNWKLPNIYLQVKYKDILDNPINDVKKLIENFMNSSEEFSGIISCTKCHEAMMIAKQLTKLGIPAAAYCSKLEEIKRNQNEKKWIDGKIIILAITHKFGMKFIKPSLRCIIHWSPPLRLEQYYRQIGSYLRNNEKILCRMYFGIEDWINMQATVMRKTNQTSEEFKTMIQYCLSTECRHLTYSRYFGININPCGDACDFCEKESIVRTRQEKFKEFANQHDILPTLKQTPIIAVYNLNKTGGIVKDLEPIHRCNIYELLQSALNENYEKASCINKPDIEIQYLAQLARGLEYSIFSTSYKEMNYKYKMMRLIERIKKSTESKKISNYILNYKFQLL
ncbi:ATP-dependent DNA helicase Q5-like [Chelonus insularis]|uniref:ATP-dependent DNA helicase Q5-like n=1 Tax=Chelonus insularis TaxID=460826 RepID=UPI00158DCAF2|nr:ATP-dependent DNA helicase Q5-like [Chelonus insularis]XP_034937960.1 ATP-dependent DNA helicase Q5-like [Chelonus insularis]